MMTGTNGKNGGYQEGPWSLDDLFPGFDTPELQAGLEQLTQQAEAFEALREKLSPEMDGDAFCEILEAYDALIRQASRVQSFAGLSFAADTQDQQAQSFMAR